MVGRVCEEISLGTLEATSPRVAEAVTPQVQELKDWVKIQRKIGDRTD